METLFAFQNAIIKETAADSGLPLACSHTPVYLQFLYGHAEILYEAFPSFLKIRLNLGTNRRRYGKLSTSSIGTNQASCAKGKLFVRPTPTVCLGRGYT